MVKRSVLIAALIGLLVVLVVAACRHDWKPTPPFFMDYGECLAGHEEDTSYVAIDGNGYPVFVPSSTYVCDQHEYPAGDGPDYVRRYQQYETDLAAWLKRHPKES